MTNTIQTSPLSDFSVTIIPAAQQAKAEAITLAKSIRIVTSTDQQQDAIAAASLMKGLLRDVEKARVAVKEPVLDAGRKIDAAAKAFSEDMTAEVKRVEGLASAYQAEQNRIAEALRAEEERKQRQQREAEEAERQREQAALAAIAAAAEAERRANLAAIAAAADDKAREEAQRKADEDAAARAEEVRINQQACREAEEARLEAERDRAMQLHTVVAPKAAGAVVKVLTDYELKDIRALYAARPDLVELSERRSLILAAISIPGHPAIPGIYEFQQTKVQSKAS